MKSFAFVITLAIIASYGVYAVSQGTFLKTILTCEVLGVEIGAQSFVKVLLVVKFKSDYDW